MTGPARDPIPQLLVGAHSTDGRRHPLVIPDATEKQKVALGDRSSLEAGGVHVS
jgi:hypothetical protein